MCYNVIDLPALCGGILIATQVAQNISSPNYPHPANQAVQCQWTIDSGFDNQTVSLSLLDIDLNEDSSCSQEYVQFRDSPLVGTTSYLIMVYVGSFYYQ